MEKVLYNPSIDVPTNGHQATNENSAKTNGTNGSTNGADHAASGASGDDKPNLLEAAKSAAVEVTNGLKGMTLST